MNEFKVTLKDGTVLTFPSLPVSFDDVEVMILKNLNNQYQLWTLSKSYKYRYNTLMFQYSNRFNLRYSWDNIGDNADSSVDEMTISVDYYDLQNNTWVKSTTTFTGTGYKDATANQYVQLVYSTQDLIIDTYNPNYTLEQQSYYTFLPTSNLDLSNWDSSSNHFIIYYADAIPKAYEYDRLYIRPWGSSEPYQEFPYEIDSVNTLPEHDASANDVDLDSYTNLDGKTIRNRVRHDVATLEFNVPTMSGQELHDLFDMTSNVWLDCYFFYESEWDFVSKKMYRNATVKYHKYYIDKDNPENNIYQNVNWGFVEE